MRLILLLGALAAICANRADAAAQMIPIKAFAALPAMQKPVLSPDGHHIAAISVGDVKTGPHERLAELRDPSGNLLMLYEPLPRPS